MLALSLILTLAAQAEEDRGGERAYCPPPMPVDENLFKVTMFRLWYLGGAGAPPLCLARENAEKKVQMIDTGLTAGNFSPYVPMRPGEITLHFLDGNLPLPADPNEKLPLEEKKLIEPLEIDLKAGSYMTLVVRAENGKLSAEVLVDERPGGTATPEVVVRDFSGLPGWTVRIFDPVSNSRREVWNSSFPSSGPFPVLSAQKVYYIEYCREIDGVLQSIGMFETELPKGTRCSLVLFRGPNGEGYHRTNFDAAPGESYSAERIKRVASGGQ